MLTLKMKIKILNEKFVLLLTAPLVIGYSIWNSYELCAPQEQIRNH